MTFKLSQRSINRMEYVHPDLQKVVEQAIFVTDVDFGVTEGLRAWKRQEQLMKEGKTKTMKSKHLTCIEGHNSLWYGGAVDIVAYKDGLVCWDDPALYESIAKAFFKAAEQVGVQIRWGGDWDRDGDRSDQTFDDLCHFELFGYDFSWKLFEH